LGAVEANTFSLELSVHIDYLLKQYGTRLDIIYEDGLEEGNTYGYSKLIYWSDLGLSPYPYTSPSPSPSPNQPQRLHLHPVKSIYKPFICTFAKPINKPNCIAYSTGHSFA